MASVKVNSVKKASSPVGIGSESFRLGLFIANRPPVVRYQQLEEMQPFVPGELSCLVNETGNHWRKIFNISAKLGFALYGKDCPDWQSYREKRLFQQDCPMSLVFSPIYRPSEEQLFILLGKTYRQSLFVDLDFTEISEAVFLHPQWRLLQVPYFDYRQLSNQKIADLLGLIQQRYPEVTG